MKTLIIHPKDKSTDFLIPIYKNIPNKFIVRGFLSQKEIHNIIINYDRIIMLGHGSPMGLMSVGQFKDSPFIINRNSVPFLKDKECIFIWCNSDKFVEKYDLKGFYSGMFISEVGESKYCGLRGVTQDIVDESNKGFSKIMGSHINETLKGIYENVLRKYETLTDTNEVSKYNYERLYLNI